MIESYMKKKVYLIAEIGINHNGSIETAKKLIDQAKITGFDCVKFQKRDLRLCVPEAMKKVKRVTPWGNITYWKYKQKIEFDEKDYKEIDEYCKNNNIDWTASAWDINSFEFLKKFNLPFIKIPSDKARDKKFIKKISNKDIPLIISTGGCNKSDIEFIYNTIPKKNLSLMHCTSVYPCPTDKMNLSKILSLKKAFKVPIGFSSHHTSPVLTAMSACLGAQMIEVHITLNRALWGTDQSMSLEKRGCEILVNSVRNFEKSFGSGQLKSSQEEHKTLSRTKNS